MTDSPPRAVAPRRIARGDATALAAAALPASVPSELERAERRRDELIGASHALATRVAYAADWTAFETWCAEVSTPERPFTALPVSDLTLATWVGALRVPARELQKVPLRTMVLG